MSTRDDAATAEHQIVISWMSMREVCEHYHGFKETEDSVQCDHPHQRDDWCRLMSCPRVRAAADAMGVE